VQYKFKIQIGVLYWQYDKSINMDSPFIKASNIDLLGDITYDGKLDEDDVKCFEDILEEKAEEISDDGGILNLDEDDLNLLKELVSV